MYYLRRSLVALMSAAALSISMLQVFAGDTTATIPKWDRPAGAPVPTVKNPGRLFAGHEDDPHKNISGVICINSATCIAVADESVAIQAFQIGKAGGQLVITPGKDYVDAIKGLCSDQEKVECKETDLEAVARDRNILYAVASLGIKRSKGKMHPQNWALWRFEIDPGTGAPLERVVAPQKVIRALIASVPALKPSIDRTLQCGGLNVEGLAINKGRLFLGLRSPSIRSLDVAFLLAFDADEIFKSSPDAAKLDARLYAVHFATGERPNEGVGIRALETVGDTFIIVTGDAGVSDLKVKEGKNREKRRCGDPDTENSHSNRQLDLPFIVWTWKAGDPSARPIGSFTFKDEHKLEAVAVLPRAGGDTSKVDLLFAFDGKDAKNGDFHVRRDVNLAQPLGSVQPPL